MRGSLRVATLAGIGVYIHWTFLLLLAWVVGSDLYAGKPAGDAAMSALFVLAVFGCVVLHELGHALAARMYGVKTRDITLLPIGGVARLERMPAKPLQELVVAIAGPAVNVLIAGALLPVVLVLYGGPSFSPLEALEAPGSRFIVNLLTVNIVLVIFNMIPAFPMDGGRVLRALLATAMDYTKATRIAGGVGQVIAVGFAVAGVFGQPMLLLIAVFVWLGAQAETQGAMVRAAIGSAKVRDAMITEFAVLRTGDTLAAAMAELMRGSQADFPVMDGDRFAGVLTRDALLKAAAERGDGAPVDEAVRRDCPPVREEESLVAVLERMRQGGCTMLPVQRDGRLVGLVTMDNIGELLMVREARARAGTRAQRRAV